MIQILGLSPEFLIHHRHCASLTPGEGICERRKWISVGSHAAGEGFGLALHTHQILLDQQLRSFQALPHICYLLTYHVLFIKIDPYNQNKANYWK